MKTTSTKYLGIEFKIFSMIGIISSILGAFLAPVDLWGKLAIGYVAIIIICACFMFGARDTWKAIKKDTKELIDLYTKQCENPREYLSTVRFSIGGLEKDDPNVIYVNIGFISQLLEGLKVERMIGKIMVREITQDFEFTTNNPYHFNKLLNSSAIKEIHQQVILSEPIKKRITEMRQDQDDRIRLEVIIHRDIGDPIHFSPTDNDPSNLTWSLKNGRI
jgi:hypothetical protein